MRPGWPLFRRVCPCRAAAGAGGDPVIVHHRCQILPPMVHDNDASPPGYPRRVWEGKTAESWPYNPVLIFNAGVRGAGTCRFQRYAGCMRYAQGGG
jgi:hypothetical protein